MVSMWGDHIDTPKYVHMITLEVMLCIQYIDLELATNQTGGAQHRPLIFTNILLFNKLKHKHLENCTKLKLYALYK